MKPMNATELREAMTSLGLTKDELADKLGLGERQIRKYLNGIPIKQPTAMLIRILVSKRRDRNALIGIGYERIRKPTTKKEDHHVVEA